MKKAQCDSWALITIIGKRLIPRLLSKVGMRLHVFVNGIQVSLLLSRALIMNLLAAILRVVSSPFHIIAPLCFFYISSIVKSGLP